MQRILINFLCGFVCQVQSVCASGHGADGAVVLRRRGRGGRLPVPLVRGGDADRAAGRVPLRGLWRQAAADADGLEEGHRKTSAQADHQGAARRPRQTAGGQVRFGLCRLHQ